MTVKCTKTVSLKYVSVTSISPQKINILQNIYGEEQLTKCTVQKGIFVFNDTVYVQIEINFYLAVGLNLSAALSIFEWFN